MVSHPPVEAFILRRTQILDFIRDQDANRYKKYIQLLGLAALDNVQKSFVDAAQTAESQRQASQRNIDFQLAAFRDPVSAWLPTSLASLLTYCSEITRGLGIEDLKVWGDIDSVISRLESKRSPQTKTRIDALNKAIVSLEGQFPVTIAELVTSANAHNASLRIQVVFDQIANKVLLYYKKLHDIDGDTEKSECTGISLESTSRAAAGGLKLAIQFLGLADSCDPQAFLSEGHLDSLGLCLFLATVRTFNPPGTMLVLDDILTSIDREHRHRVAELVFEEFGDFQLVLTTHDEHWFGILQTKAQAYGDQDKWLFKKIARWTVELGPEAATFENTWAHIETNLKEDGYRELGGPLRVVLEDFLKRVAEKLELRVRYKSDRKHTFGDFISAGIQNKIRDELVAKCQTEEASIKQEVGRVFGTGDLINFLSHDNPGRLEVTFSQAKDFTDGLKALAKRCKDNDLIKNVSG